MDGLSDSDIILPLAASYNIDTIKKNTQTLIYPSKEVGLEINTEKTKYMLLFRHQNTGQNHDIKIGNILVYFENVAEFRYLERL
jgi:hypothetical protein